MDAEIERLLNLIDEAVSLLRRCGETRWADWLADDAETIRRLDLAGVEHLLSAFGGMGSLSDLWIGPPNSQAGPEGEAAAINQELRALLAEIYARADRLRREELRADRR